MTLKLYAQVTSHMCRIWIHVTQLWIHVTLFFLRVPNTRNGKIYIGSPRGSALSEYCGNVHQSLERLYVRGVRSFPDFQPGKIQSVSSTSNIVSLIVSDTFRINDMTKKCYFLSEHFTLTNLCLHSIA